MVGACGGSCSQTGSLKKKREGEGERDRGVCLFCRQPGDEGSGDRPTQNPPPPPPLLSPHNTHNPHNRASVLQSARHHIPPTTKPAATMREIVSSPLLRKERQEPLCPSFLSSDVPPLSSSSLPAPLRSAPQPPNLDACRSRSRAASAATKSVRPASRRRRPGGVARGGKGVVVFWFFKWRNALSLARSLALIDLSSAPPPPACFSLPPRKRRRQVLGGTYEDHARARGALVEEGGAARRARALAHTGKEG